MNTMNENQKEKAKSAHSTLTAWLTGLGVPANWAKVGAGLIVGGTIGALATCQQSCTATYTQTAAGDISATVTVVQPVEVEK